MPADADEEELREAQELTFLLDQRRRIALAREGNVSLQETLAETIKHADLAQAELDGVEELLDLADAMHSYDASHSSIVHSKAFLQTCLPLFPGLEDVTTVAAEVTDLKALLLNSIWNRSDDRCLEEAVLNQCRRLAAYEFKADRSCRDPLALAAQMSNEELALLSMPKYMQLVQSRDTAGEVSADESDAEEPRAGVLSRKKGIAEKVDWEEVSLSLSAAPTANAHTAEACRTRWLMVARPGINDDPWTEEEIDRLKRAVQEELDSLGDDDRLDWSSVAETMEVSVASPLAAIYLLRKTANALSVPMQSGRRPIDCVTAYQRLPFAVRSAPHLNIPPTFDQKGAYDDELLRQASIWGSQWGLLADKLNYNPSTIIDKFDTALESENEAKEWDEGEMQRLREAIASQAERFGSHARRANSEALAGSSSPTCQDQASRMDIADLHFERVARHVRTRTPKACQDRYAGLIASPAASQAAESLHSLPASTIWTTSEEKELLTLREQEPEWLWTEIARSLSQRRTAKRKITGPMAIDRWMELKGLEGDEERQKIRKADAQLRGARDRKRQKERDALAPDTARFEGGSEQGKVVRAQDQQPPRSAQLLGEGESVDPHPEPVQKKRRGRRQTGQATTADVHHTGPAQRRRP